MGKMKSIHVPSDSVEHHQNSRPSDLHNNRPSAGPSFDQPGFVRFRPREWRGKRLHQDRSPESQLPGGSAASAFPSPHASKEVCGVRPGFASPGHRLSCGQTIALEPVSFRSSGGRWQVSRDSPRLWARRHHEGSEKFLTGPSRGLPGQIVGQQTAD
ncbi:hypothetical protein VTK56DRAFT_7572 [Thermocarpiscus australiensis]